MKTLHLFEHITNDNLILSRNFSIKIKTIFIFLFIVTFFFTSCFSVKVATVDLKISPHTNSNLFVFPFQGENTSLAASWYGGQSYNKPSEHIHFSTELTQQDYSKLRESLISSISNTKAFLSVIEADTTIYKYSKEDLLIKFQFGPSGMNASKVGMNFTCIFNCLVSLQKSDNTEIINKELNITEKSYASDSEAKNKAIKSFIEKIAEILNNIKK
jgi:hypothetical protein